MQACTTVFCTLCGRQMYPAEPLNVQASVAAYDLDNLRLDVPGMPKTLHVQFLVKDVLIGGQCDDLSSEQPPNGLQVRFVGAQGWGFGRSCVVMCPPVLWHTTVTLAWAISTGRSRCRSWAPIERTRTHWSCKTWGTSN